MTSPRRLLVPLLAILTLLACSSGRSTGFSSLEGGAPPQDGEDGGPTGNPPRNDPGGPELLAFGASAKSMTEGESIVVSAVFAAHDGGSSVAGGVLVDEMSGATVVSFHATAGQTGLEATASWSSLSAATVIAFDKGATPSRTLRASFFDDAGRKTERLLDVTLTCAGLGACGGKCVDTSVSREHCGQCGNACPMDQAGLRARTSCLSGVCAQAFAGCAPIGTAQTCNDVCAAKGKTCSNTCSDGDSGGIGGSSAQCDDHWTTPRCTETISGGFGFTFASCCCS
jgi:hypothetical protein